MYNEQHYALQQALLTQARRVCFTCNLSHTSAYIVPKVESNFLTRLALASSLLYNKGLGDEPKITCTKNSKSKSCKQLHDLQWCKSYCIRPN